MSEYTIFVSFGVFVVWMQRKHRWNYMLLAMENKATVVGTKRASTAPIAKSTKTGNTKAVTPNPANRSLKTIFNKAING